MDGIRQYAVSVVSVTIIFSILSCVVSQGTTKSLLHLISGIILTLVIIRPFFKMRLPSFDEIALPQITAGEMAADRGKELAQDSMADIIKASCEAYILDKAADLGAEINVSVMINQEYIPFSAALSGKISSNAKQQLERILETDLGIAKENQSWVG